MLHQKGRGPEASVTENTLELSSSPRVGDGSSARFSPLSLFATTRASSLRGQTCRVKTDLPVGVIIFGRNTGEKQDDLTGTTLAKQLLIHTFSQVECPGSWFWEAVLA